MSHAAPSTQLGVAFREVEGAPSVTEVPEIAGRLDLVTPPEVG